MNNTEVKKDFTEAKRVLDELKNYAKAKIVAKNTGVVEEIPTQVMNLASQPELISDHIEEESVLAPLGDATISAPVENIPDNSGGLQEASNDGVKETSIQDNGQKEEVAVIQNSEGVVQATSQEETSTVEAIDQTNNKTMGDATSTEQAQAINNTAIDATQGAVNVSIDNSNVGATIVEPSAEIPAINPMGAVVDSSASESEISMESTEPATMSGVSGENVLPQIQEIEPIPEISIQSTGIANETGAYQAGNNGAQATISDVTAAVSDRNVVMPTGTTAEEANDQTLVVGPESFGPTR